MSRRDDLEDIASLIDMLDDPDETDSLINVIDQLSGYALDYGRARAAITKLKKHDDPAVAAHATQTMTEVKAEINARKQQTDFTDLPITGISYTQPEIARCKVGNQVLLVRQPNNKHDRNAIAVFADISFLIWLKQRRRIGWIPREVAKRIAERMPTMPVRGHIARTWRNYGSDLLGCSITFRIPPP